MDGYRPPKFRAKKATGEIGVEVKAWDSSHAWGQFAEDGFAGLFDLEAKVFQDEGGHAAAFLEQAEEDVFGADVGVVQGFGFACGELEGFPGTGGVGNWSGGRMDGAEADEFLDFQADGFVVHAEVAQNV